MKRQGLRLRTLAAVILASVLAGGCSSPDAKPEVSKPVVAEPTPDAVEKPTPMKPQVVVPRAVRTLEAHVEAIVSQLGEPLYTRDPIRFDSDVDTERQIDWGFEGSYWEAALSFMGAASLEIVETWSETIHLGVGPSDYRLVDVSADCLVGFRRHSALGDVPAILEFEAVGPPWKDVLGRTAPLVTADPPIVVPEGAVQVTIPEGTKRLGVAWTLITRTRVSTEEIPLEVGLKQPIPGTAGTITVDRIRTTPTGFLGVSWTPDNIELCEHGLVLEDGSFVKPRQGPGWYSSGEREFENPDSKPVALRVKVVLEKHEEPMRLQLEPARWLSDSATGQAPLAGKIRWGKTTRGKVMVEMGLILPDGMNRVPSQMFLKFGDAIEAVPESVPGDVSYVALSFHPGGEVEYRLHGLDVGEYTLWMRAGNWIESRRLTVPQDPRQADFAVDDAEAAELQIAAPEGSEPYLIPEPREGEDPRLPKVDQLRIFLGKAMKGEFSAKGLKPGRYLLVRSGGSRKVDLKKGRTQVDFR